MRGLSLPEVAIAMVVLSVLIVGGLRAFAYAQTTISDVNHTKQARDVALSIADELDSGDFSNTYFPRSLPERNLDGVSYTPTLDGELIGSVNKEMWRINIVVTYPQGVYTLAIIKGVD